MTVHPVIERLALLGWRLHPASRFGRAACIKGAAEAATHDLVQLDKWGREFPGCNWRVVLGGSGVWALDVDVPSADHASDGVTALRHLVAVHGQIPQPPITRSGGGGFALFFRHSGKAIVRRTGTPAPGLDPRRGRFAITVPPSVHVTTRGPYRWLIAPWEVTPPPAPSWLLKLLGPPPARADTGKA
jgi:hypothetical protein